MIMENFKCASIDIGYHGKILWKGFLRMMYGALTAGLFALAVYGFVMIGSESGWTAVCEFITSTATVVVGLSCVYIQGRNSKKTNKIYTK